MGCGSSTDKAEENASQQSKQQEKKAPPAGSAKAADMKASSPAGGNEENKPDAKNIEKWGSRGRLKDVYDIGETIGTGGFAVVKMGRHKKTGKQVAIKIMTLPDAGTEDADYHRNQIFLEIDILSKLEHPNVLKMYEYFLEGKKVCMVTELLHGGEMLDAVLNRGMYSEADAKQVFRQLLESLKYLHSVAVVHRDLKLENLLLKEPDDLNTVKLADFGLAKRAAQQGMETICGSPMYVAPEVIRFEPGNDPYGSPCDMWSAGVILYILLCGVPPFDDESEAVLYNPIAKGDYSLDDPVWAIVSDDAKDFIAKLLCVDPSRRLTADQALAHPWMNKETTAAQSAALPIAQGKLKAYAARMAAPRMTIQPGSFLIKQGEKGSEVFFIKSGTCEVLVYNPAEGEQFPGRVVAERGAGDVVGEMATVGSPQGQMQTRSASLRAVTVVEVMVVGGNEIMKVMRDDATLQGEIEQTMAERRNEMKSMEKKMYNVQIQQHN